MEAAVALHQTLARDLLGQFFFFDAHAGAKQVFHDLIQVLRFPYFLYEFIFGVRVIFQGLLLRLGNFWLPDLLVEALVLLRHQFPHLQLALALRPIFVFWVGLRRHLPEVKVNELR